MIFFWLAISSSAFNDPECMVLLPGSQWLVLSFHLLDDPSIDSMDVAKNLDEVAVIDFIAMLNSHVKIWLPFHRREGCVADDDSFTCIHRSPRLGLALLMVGFHIPRLPAVLAIHHAECISFKDLSFRAKIFKLLLEHLRLGAL